MSIGKTIPFLKHSIGQLILTGFYLLVVFALIIAANVFFPERYITFATVLLSIVIEASPFLLAGALVSGGIHVFLDQRLLLRVVPRQPVLGALLGAARLWQKPENMPTSHSFREVTWNVLHIARFSKTTICARPLSIAFLRTPFTM